MKAARKLVVFILFVENFMLQSVALGKGKFVKNFFGRDKGEELKNGN